MRPASSLLPRALLGVALLAALGFGAAQAVAAPDVNSGELTCSNTHCNAHCVGLGYLGGICVGSPPKCLCY